MNSQPFTGLERAMACFAGIFNLGVGLAFFFLPELHWPIWPTPIPSLLARFIGAIILGNSAGALLLTTQRDWARVRPLALVAVVYGTLVALALLYHLLWLHAEAIFWIYFLFDMPFLLVFYALFVYHEVIQRVMTRQKARAVGSSNAGTVR